MSYLFSLLALSLLSILSVKAQYYPPGSIPNGDLAGYISTGTQPGVYYVANSGSNSNNGNSPSHPFQTIAHAISIASGGNTIRLKGGDTFNEINLSPTVYLNFNSYGSGQGTISTGTSSAFTLTNTSANITNLNFVANILNSSGDPAPWIINFNFNDDSVHSNGPSVTYCNFTGGLGAFLVTTEDASTKVNNIVVSHNVAAFPSGAGFFLFGNYQGQGSPPPGRASAFSNVYMGYNVVHDTVSYTSTSGFNCSGYGLNGSVATNIIEHNLIYNISSGVGNSAGGMFFQASDNVTCQYNVVYNLQGNGQNIDNCAFDIDLSDSNVIFQYNYCYNIQGPGIEFLSDDGGARSGNIIRWNVFVNCRTYSGNTLQYGVISFVGDDPCQLYGNTVVSGDAVPNGGGIGFGNGASANKVLYNNAIIMTSGINDVNIADGSPGGNFAADYNYYESGGGNFLASLGGSSYTTLSSWTSSIHGDAHALAASSNTLVNPIQAPLVPATLSQLQNYFAPAGGSVLIGAGANLAAIAGISPGPVDASGANLVPPYAIGALAYP